LNDWLSLPTRSRRKQLELLHEIAPNTTLVAFLVNPKNPIAESDTRDLKSAAVTTRQQILVLNASNEGELDNAFAALVQQNAGALLVQINRLPRGFGTLRHGVTALDFISFKAHSGSSERRRRHASHRTDPRGQDFLLPPVRSPLLRDGFAAFPARQRRRNMCGLPPNHGYKRFCQKVRLQAHSPT
jgi:hypothetical protein